EFDGDLDDYADWLLRSKPGDRAAGSSGNAAGNRGDSPDGVPGDETRSQSVGGDRREARRQAAERRAQLATQLAPLERQLRKLESELERTERELAALDSALAQPEAYDDTQRAAGMSRERAALAKRRDEIEHDWLEAAAERDALRDRFEGT
nr:hypothetical protein [Burkholderiaceae bacterium]